MSRRINVTLPEEAARLLDRVAAKGSRSRFIADAVMHYVTSRGRRLLAERLESGYRANAQRDLAIAEEWFSLEEEPWRPTAPGARAKD